MSDTIIAVRVFPRSATRHRGTQEASLRETGLFRKRGIPQSTEKKITTRVVGNPTPPEMVPFSPTIK